MYRHLPPTENSRRGSVAVEYVCLTTIIIAILIPSITSIGSLMEGRFTALNESATGEATQPTASAAPTPAAVAATKSTAGNQGFGSENLIVTEFSLVFAVLAIVAVGVLAIRRHRFHNQGQEQEDELARPKLPVHLSTDLFEKRQKIQLAISTHWCKGVDGRLLVSELMTRGPKCVFPETSREEARELMQKRDLHHLLVTDDNGVLVGVLSSHDFDEREGDDVGSVMTADPFRIRASNTVGEAVTVLLTHRIHCLPVENSEGQLVGVLTGSDLAMGLQCALRAIEEVSMVLAGQKNSVMPVAVG